MDYEGGREGQDGTGYSGSITYKMMELQEARRTYDDMKG